MMLLLRMVPNLSITTQRGVGVERGFISVLLIHTTFGITFLSAEKFLKQKKHHNVSFILKQIVTKSAFILQIRIIPSIKTVFHRVEDVRLVVDVKAMAIQDEKSLSKR